MDHGFWTGGRPNLFDVQRHDVSVLDGVTESGEPEGVATGTAPDVRDQGRCLRQFSSQDLLGALELQHADAVAESVLLLALRVVRAQASVQGSHGVQPAARAVRRLVIFAPRTEPVLPAP